MSSSDYVYLDVHIITETEKAFEVLVLKTQEYHWFPKSQISDPEDYKEGDRNCQIGVKEWIAKEKGLSDEK